MSELGEVTRWKDTSILDKPVHHYRNILKKKTPRHTGLRSSTAYNKKWVYHKKLSDRASVASSASGFLSYRSWTNKSSNTSWLSNKARTYNPENVVVRLTSPTSMRVSWRPPEDVGNEISRYTIVVSSANGGKIGETIVEVDNPVKNHYIHEIQNLPARKKLIVTVQATRKGYQSDSIKREISTYEEKLLDIGELNFNTNFKKTYKGNSHFHHISSCKLARNTITPGTNSRDVPSLRIVLP